jgi:predicted RNase H-like nuclease (RuvC/YqgF family)
MKFSRTEQEITRLQRTIILDERKVEHYERRIRDLKDGIDGMKTRLWRLKNERGN